MDVDTFIAQHRADWDRLATLSGRQRLTGLEADELVDLYQRVGTHLSTVHASRSDPVLEARLSGLLIRARSTVSGTSTPVIQTVARFITVGFPAAVWRVRWWWLAVGLACIGLCALIMYRVLSVPGLAGTLLSDHAAEQLVNYEFANYYSENPATDFALLIFLNNALVVANSMVTGIGVLPVLALLYRTMENTGIIGGFMLEAGRADVFFGLLLPHGLLELTIVFLGAAAGLRIGWAWMAPGMRTRAQALAQEGRILGTIAIGLAGWLLISALVEAFITPSQLPAWARLLIGGLVWAGFLGYVAFFGHRAVRAGETGDLAATERSAEAPTEAAI
ncbi:stage II sporulation protein M [Propionibacteriaceae bacterium Y2011]|uniref:stage II sporulation protein M n=1 Tax=Microlunatus sp. Y2014 TaxID=3418488 RepID=UPI003B496EBC